MAKKKEFHEDLFIRVPEGTKDTIDELRGNERQSDFLRRVLLSKLEEMKQEINPEE